jgi:hypothetical protein
MGAATLINVSVHTLYQSYGFGGKRFLYAIWGLWWVDVAISCLCVWGMVQIMYVPLFTYIFQVLTVPSLHVNQDYPTTSFA